MNPLLPPWSCHCDATTLLPSECLKNLVGELDTSPSYAEAIQQEMLSHTLTLTHVSTEFQLADLLTKPISSSINATIFPQWGLGSFTPSCLQHLFTILTSSGLRGSLRLPLLLAFPCWHSLTQSMCLIHLLLLSGSTSLYLLLSLEVCLLLCLNLLALSACPCAGSRSSRVVRCLA